MIIRTGMLPAERRQYILNHLAGNHAVRVGELAGALAVSRITIRRDLEEMEDTGLLARTRGGAVPRSILLHEERYDQKQKRNLAVKRLMARAALSLIRPGSTVLLDAGTSVYELASLFSPDLSLSVLTYDLKTALLLDALGIHTIFACGEIVPFTGSLVGPCAEEFIGRFHFDFAFLGTAAIGRDQRLYTPTLAKTGLKRAVMAAADTRVLLADASKFCRTSFSEVCSLTDFDVLITNRSFTPEAVEAFGTKGLEVVRVEDPEDEQEGNPFGGNHSSRVGGSSRHIAKRSDS